MKYSARSRGLLYDDKKQFRVLVQMQRGNIQKKANDNIDFSLSPSLSLSFSFLFFLFKGFINGFPALMFNFFLKFIRCSILPVPFFSFFPRSFSLSFWLAASTPLYFRFLGLVALKSARAKGPSAQGTTCNDTRVFFQDFFQGSSPPQMSYQA